MTFVLSMLTQYLFPISRGFSIWGQEVTLRRYNWGFILPGSKHLQGVLAFVCSQLFLVYKKDGVGAGGLLETLNFQHAKKMPPQAMFI